jgi:hypothetical protein
MTGDPYDTGTPKYQTAQDIYEALCELTQTEEMSVLSEMFQDVSYDNQEYYYTEKGYALKEKFEELSDYGSKMWLIDLAVTQMELSNNQGEIHDTIFEVLVNPDLAKRIGFKKCFIDHVLWGDKSQYDKIAEAFSEELYELNRFDYSSMVAALYEAGKARDGFFARSPNAEYNRLCNALRDKIMNLRLSAETQLIVDCRALLFSYDDFIYGLRMNQHLYEQQEHLYRSKVAELKGNYKELVKRLFVVAESKGFALGTTEIKMLLAAADIPVDAD